MQSFCAGRVIALTGDITDVAVDAIVNAANTSLLGGAGVDGAIHRRGGRAILEACRELRRLRFAQGLPTGAAVMTTAGALRARHVIHTVGPIYDRDADAAGLLAACYRNCLSLAQMHDLHSIAFPAISTGLYGYPKAAAAQIASLTIAAALPSCPAVAQVQLVFFSATDLQTFIDHQRF